MNKLVRQTVWSRSKGYCEYCGKSLDPEGWDFHHRQLGTKLDLVANGIACCHRCHLEGIHGNPFLARERGFIISRFTLATDFPNVAVLLFGGINDEAGIWVLLTEEGGYAKVA